MRIGIVNYVNARPLAWGLLHGARAGAFETVLLPPARVADELAAGTIDCGLVPSIELARIPDLLVVPGLAIAANHEVRSVLLVSRRPVAEIRTVALDEASRTSAALVRILLDERYGLRPTFRSQPADVETMLATSDAALVIGDPALAVERERHVVLDLAGEWLEWTGLPFVFALWAVRRAAARPDLVTILHASFESGMAALPEIVAAAAAETRLPEAVLLDYYTRNLRFRMGPAEQAGLAEFLRRAATHGLAEASGSLAYLASSLSSVR
ncbi:MAG: menaquinone biosynthesis protein [Thermoanaerobaculia bacterium]